MSEPKFTPPPWRITTILGVQMPSIEGNNIVHVNGQQRNAQGISSASYSETVCDICGDLSLEAPAANARLIAQSPALLTELDNLCNILETSDLSLVPPDELRGIEGAIKSAREIIEKALDIDS